MRALCGEMGRPFSCCRPFVPNGLTSQLPCFAVCHLRSREAKRPTTCPAASKICRAKNEDATELAQWQQVLLVTGHDAVGPRCQRALESHFIVAIRRGTGSTFNREDQVGKLRQGFGPRQERMGGVFQSKPALNSNACAIPLDFTYFSATLAA